MKIVISLIVVFIISFVYFFSVDRIVEIIVKYIVGQNIYYFMMLLLIRILASYTIGLVIGLNQRNSFTIAVGVAFILFSIEVLYHFRERNKETSVRDS